MLHQTVPPLAMTVSLTRGYDALISLVDYDLIRPFSWRTQLDNKDHEKQYAATEYRDGSRRRKLYMHRLIAGAEKGMVVDHLNHDGLDNRRTNIRVVGFSDNMQNCQLIRSVTGFRGVTQTKYGRFRARICRDGEDVTIGVYDTAQEAADAYDRRALALYGPLAWTNIERDRGEMAEVYDFSSIPF